MIGLYRKGLVYLDVPIADSDYIVGKFTFWATDVVFLLLRSTRFILMFSLKWKWYLNARDVENQNSVWIRFLKNQPSNILIFVETVFR